MRGVRTRRELEGFDISRRLMTRLGALLTRKVEVSPTVLEAAGPGSALEKLLLSPAVIEKDLEADSLEQASFEAALDEEGLVLTVVDRDDGWKIVALKEEVLAEEGWASSEAGTDGAAPVGNEDTGDEARLRGGAERPSSRDIRPVREGEGPPPEESLFSEQRIHSLKVTFFTSADEEARIEALRFLAFSPIAPEEKTELLFKALGDEAAAVRVAAAALLKEVGLDTGTVETLRSLVLGEEEERLFAVERLGKEALAGKGLQAAAAVVALVSELRLETAPSVRKRVLSALEEAAAFISASEDRARELVSLLLAHLGPRFRELAFPVRKLIARVGELLPALVSEMLWKEVEETPDRRVKTLLLGVLADFEGADRERITQAMAREIALPEERDVDFRSFSSYLHRMVPESVTALVDAYPGAVPSQKKYIVRLLDDICRYEDVPVRYKEAVAGLFLRYLDGSGRDLRISIMSTFLPRDPSLPEETRRRLAALFLDNIHDVHMPTDIENIEFTIARMGFPAVQPLIAHLEERYARKERVRAARLLGELGRLEGLKAPRSRKAAKELENILRALELQLVERFPEPGEVLVAQGKICASGAVRKDIVEIMARNLRKRLEEEPSSPSLCEAAGWTAASPKAPAKFVSWVMSRFFEILERPDAEIPTDTRLEAGLKIYELGAEAGFYTDLLPAVLKGLSLIYLGHPKDEQRRKTIVGFLLRKWRELNSGERLWGPGNVTQLVRVFEEIGADASTSPGTRISIVRALGKKLHQIPVMNAVASILQKDDSPGEMARLASAFIVAILRRRDDEGRFEEEEREEMLAALAKVVVRRHLETRMRGTEGIRETVVDMLMAGLKDDVPGCYDSLVSIRDCPHIPEELRKKVAEALKNYQSIVPFGA